MTSKIDGEEMRYFHTRKNGVDRVWVDHASFLSKVWGLTGEPLLLISSKLGGCHGGSMHPVCHTEATCCQCQAVVIGCEFVGCGWTTSFLSKVSNLKGEALQVLCLTSAKAQLVPWDEHGSCLQCKPCLYSSGWGPWVGGASLLCKSGRSHR